MRKELKNLSPKEYRKKWGIPDWRKASEYPKTLSDCMWRWQFLRRREDYRNKYQQWAARIARFNNLAALDATRFSTEARELGEDIGASFAEYGFVSFVPVNPAESDCGLIAFERQRADIGNWYALFRQAFYTSFNSWALRPGIEPRKVYPTVLLPDHTLYVFDMAKPIAPQIRRAEKLLSARQHEMRIDIKNSRLHREKWRDHLRVIDARAERATYATIGAVLRPDLIYSEAAARAEELHTAAKSTMERLTYHPI